MDPTGPWDRDRVDDYLSAARVPVRIGCRTPSDRPWIVSLWFAWDPDAGDDPDRPSGAIRCATSADADLVEFVGHDDEVRRRVEEVLQDEQGGEQESHQ